MMPSYTQANRSFALTTPLGSDALLLAKFSGREALSELFCYKLELFALDSLDFDSLIGQQSTLRLSVPGSPTRYVNGILSEIEELQHQAGPYGPETFLRYRAELVPQLWTLGLRVRSRIWQRKSVPEILHQILQEQWQLAVSVKLTGQYPTRDYCVQYQESDLAFVMRLLEDEGIWFCFQHSENNHTLILGDAPEAHPSLSPGKPLTYDSRKGGYRDQGHVWEWSKRRRLTPTKVHLRDFHFERSLSILDAAAALPPSAAVGQSTQSFTSSEQSQVDDYPAGFARRFDRTQVDGSDAPQQLDQLYTENQRVAKLRIQAEAAKTLRCFAKSNCGHLTAGYSFALQGHFNADGPYVVAQLTQQGDQESTWLTSDGKELYTNEIEALPQAVPFRPQRLTPKPTISGTQTALVVGTGDKDIFLDRYGRVKVKFAWDLREDAGPESSCWVRVAQVWAGRRWGGFFWPRVGHEVVVSFENGDPERPLITGSVYNDRCMPPFELPLNAAKGGIKSFSMSGDMNSLCDPLANFNGLVFHDEKGNEHTEIHSERNSYQTSEQSHFHNVNGIHRLNVSERLSTHVGTLPTSGSGTGEADSPTFHWTTFSDPNKRIGVSLGSVCGLNQTNTLGMRGNVTVGDLVNLVLNPVSLLADGAALLSNNPIFSAVMAGASANFGGTINLNLARTTAISYGGQFSVNRAGRAAVTFATNYNDPGVDAGEAPFIALTLALAAATTAISTAGMIMGALDNYNVSDSLWENLLGASAAAAALWVETELLRGLYKHVIKGKQTATATATALAAKSLAATATNMATLIANDQTTMNKLDYTAGCTGNYSKFRINGAETAQFQFVGTTPLNQSVIAMDESNIKLMLGDPLTGPSISLSPTKIVLGVGPDSSITIEATGISLQVGPTCSIKLDPTGITSMASASSVKINAAEGVEIDAPGGGAKFTLANVQIAALEATIESMAALSITTVDLTETVSGTTTRNAPVTQII
jgi:type VI secretion system secreted protein VgrG